VSYVIAGAREPQDQSKHGVRVPPMSDEERSALVREVSAKATQKASDMLLGSAFIAAVSGVLSTVFSLVTLIVVLAR
jgi:hypothetical protein